MKQFWPGLPGGSPDKGTLMLSWPDIEEDTGTPEHADCAHRRASPTGRRRGRPARRAMIHVGVGMRPRAVHPSMRALESSTIRLVRSGRYVAVRAAQAVCPVLLLVDMLILPFLGD